MEARPRGRGVGRGRGQAGAQRPGQPQQPPAQQQQPQRPAQEGVVRATAPQTGAWVRPAQPGQASAWGRPQTAPATQTGETMQVAGRGAARATGTVAGGGDGAVSLEGQRGGSSVRGRIVNRNEIIFTRPASLASKQGTSGQPIKLQANFFPVEAEGKWSLYQYRVDLSPEVDSKSKIRQLVRTGMQPHLPGGYLFDGTVLFAPSRLHPDEITTTVNDDAGEHFNIKVKLVGEVSWGDRHYLQVFNIVVHKLLKILDLKLVGRNYYSPENRIVIQEHRVQLWPGYFTSMRQYEKDILLNVDLSFKFMRTDNVYDMLAECNQADIRRDFGTKMVGSIVLTFYNNKTYRVDEVDFNSTPQSTFKKADGSEISYMDYYYKQYGVRIRNTSQPMLISRSKSREIRAGMPEMIYLVPELCQLTGLTDKQRENFQLMQQLATHTRVGPGKRIEQLLKFARSIQAKPEAISEVKRWDLKINQQLVEFTGRVLPVENILGDKIQYSAGQQADWTRDVRQKPMFYAGKMERLAVICPFKLKGPTQDFVQMLTRCASGMRWNIGAPRIFDIPDDRSGTYIDKIEDLVNTSHPTMIMVVLFSQSSDRYAAIKKKANVDKGVPTQMIVSRNLTSKGVMSIATKVAIQMNAKIGGAPWSITIPLAGLMVVGYDVCRDTINKKKSFAGMVATMDKQLTRYFSFTAEHAMEEELSTNFAGFMMAACKKYHQLNGAYPERILIFRDGVGEGQLPFVIDHEVKNIKDKLSDIYKDNLKLAFVVVNKRLNTRIFNGNENPPPGTVVDNIITLPERYDFYIISQCVRQGTVGPTSYNVIEDTMGLPPDRLQILTYKMTHMYYNWSGTVKVPAPVQYAHKLSFLTAQHLHRAAHPDLSTLLYYL